MRIVGLACAALALLNGCRAESVADPAPPLVVEPAEPVVIASAPSVEVAAAITTTPATTTTAPATTTIAPATTTTAPSTKGERDRPPAGCIDAVEDLPDVEFLKRDDRRLTRNKLVVVSKSARRLMLYDEGRSVGCWRVALGFAPEGHKMIQGDGRTPEGWYRLSDKPWSSFENAIAIHYPNEADARAAAADGRIGKRTRDSIVGALDAGKVPPQSTKLGGAVLIHGGGSSFDWTLGCVALDDDELLALRDQLPKGMRTDVLILP
ncbi:MAG TPA: L,D-transpeptidase family protein [Nannocystaceae bacterium]|nr:L,D-transpeptidase family protein [Nannocystaceae bacterium]